MASGNPNSDRETGKDAPTALLPFNVFAGKTPEVGKVCSFRVVQVYDDQVEVEYAHSEDDRSEAPEPGEPYPEEMTEYLE